MRRLQEIHVRGAEVVGVALRHCLHPTERELPEGEPPVDNRLTRTASRRSGRPVAILEYVTDQPIGRVRQQLVRGHAKSFGDDYNLNVGNFPVSSFDFGHPGTVDGHALQLEGAGKSGLGPSRLHLRAEVLYPPP